MQGTGLDLGLVQCLEGEEVDVGVLQHLREDKGNHLEREDGVGPHVYQRLLHLHPEEQDKGNPAGLQHLLHLHLEREDGVELGGLHLEGQGRVGHPLLNLLDLNKGNSLDNVAILIVPSFKNYKA